MCGSVLVLQDIPMDVSFLHKQVCFFVFFTIQTNNSKKVISNRRKTEIASLSL